MAPHKIFADAMRADYAIGAFNFSQMEMLQAIVLAAEVQKSPVIAQTSEGAIEYAGLEMLSGMAKILADQTQIPIVLHLDHGKSLDMIKRCIAAGYTSVMMDASKEDFEKNIGLTKEVVEYAHDRGVWVEAELGAIMGKEGAQGLMGQKTPDSFLTKPEQAEEFVSRTGVDALAVSVGTIHGAFSGQEYIRFELLAEIQKAVPNVPLVLHGASGLADAHLRKAIQTHVCKVNVDTELRVAFEAAAEVYIKEPREDVDPRKMLGPAREAVKQVVENKIEIFGSIGMASVY